MTPSDPLARPAPARTPSAATSSGALSVFSQPVSPEADPAYNAWYDTVHIPQILSRIRGVAAVDRYRREISQEPGAGAGRTYLTVYRLEEGVDAATFLRDLTTALGDGTLDVTDSLDMTDLPPIIDAWAPADHDSSNGG